MTRVMDGDQAALALLVERYHASLLAYLYRLTGGDRPLAEDLVQETFLRLLRSSGYDPSRAFRPWLYSIATNLARDHYKSASVRHFAASLDERGSLVTDVTPGPEQIAEASEQGRIVAFALGQLPEEYRVALILRYYSGLSLHEIGEALNIPLGTVKSRLSVGTRRLRSLLASSVEGVHP